MKIAKCKQLSNTRKETNDTERYLWIQQINEAGLDKIKIYPILLVRRKVQKIIGDDQLEKRLLRC